MYVLGLQGSPRTKGNTNYLLDTFLNEMKSRGSAVEKLHAAKLDINPCTGCGNCEKNGFCIFAEDDMANQVYSMLWHADVVVLAAPVYFYNFPARIKALIDRTQALWARNYRHGIADPGRAWRRGFMLSVGATKGKNLFDGMDLTARYFFDAVGARYTDAITYRRIESPGELEKQPGVFDDVKSAVQGAGPLFSRKKVLFACRENACRSQMAAAFARQMAGDRIEALQAGSEPAEKVNPEMQAVMAEKGIDMAHRTPRGIAAAIAESPPDMIVTMGCGEQCPYVPGVIYADWDLPDPAGQPVSFMRQVRDEIEARVRQLIADQV